MKKSKIIILHFLCLFFSVNVLPAQEIIGSWHGNPDLGGMKLRIVFNISETDDGYFATMDSPDQGVKGILVDSVSFKDNNLFIRIAKISLTYNGKLEDNVIHGKLTQFGKSFDANLSKEEIKRNRPQTPEPPFPYVSEDISFRNEEAAITLAGTLTLPKENGTFPAVIFISGSGQQNRDEEIFEHKPFFVLSDYLTRKGIATLRYDDRGTGKSEGDPSKDTTKDFATDVKAAIEYLKSRKEINKKKIGLIGHSEGGLIAFMLAAENKKDIAFIVSMAGSALRGDSIILDQRQTLIKASGGNDLQALIDRNQMRQAFVILKENVEEDVIINKMQDIFSSTQSPRNVEIMAKQLSSPWMRYFLNYNPENDLKKIKCPVLALNGEKDLQVDAEANLNKIKETVKSKLTVIKYPDLNHLFQTSVTGLPSEYGQIEETLSPQMLEDITIWILDTVK